MKNTFFHFCFDKRRKLAPSLACIEDLHYICTSQPIMETERILLRRWTADDAVVLYRLASDPDVGPRAGWAPHTSVEESREVINHVFDNPTTWAIVLKVTGEPIGAIGYGSSCDCGLPALPDEPTIGYWVAKPYWNSGICTEAQQLMLNHIKATTVIK